MYFLLKLRKGVERYMEQDILEITKTMKEMLRERSVYVRIVCTAERNCRLQLFGN